MISGFCRSGFLQNAKQLASSFEAKYDKYDVVILNAMLCAYCRAGEMDNVMKTMKKMDESAISPDWNTFHILIRYFCKEKLYTLAYRTLDDMHKKGHQPEEVNQNIAPVFIIDYADDNLCMNNNDKICQQSVVTRVINMRE